MVRRSTQTAQALAEEPGTTAVAESPIAAGATDFNPADLERESAEEEPASNHAARVEKKRLPLANPFGFESLLGKESNRVHLLKSEPEKRNENGAWVIRFDSNPNQMEGYSKENPHPVLAYLKSEGFRWGFDHDGKGGWGKEWGDDPFGEDHDKARAVLHKAAEMIGATINQGRAV